MCLKFKVRKEQICLYTKMYHILRATNQKIDMKLINAYTERGKLKRK